MITIFTDGSSRGNPGPGGWGCVIVSDNVIELGGYEEITTNNRMEIMAAIKALQASEAGETISKNDGITIYTDSAYLINGITKWVKGWQAKGWVTLQKQPVINKDLWEMLIDVVRGKKISWKQVGGHVGTAGNERCDEIATMFADKKTPALFRGLFSDYSLQNILDISADPEAASKKSQSKRRSNAKAHSYVSSVGGKILTHSTWAECEARVKGKTGARYKKAVDAGEERKIIVEFSTP